MARLLHCIQFSSETIVLIVKFREPIVVEVVPCVVFAVPLHFCFDAIWEVVDFLTVNVMPRLIQLNSHFSHYVQYCLSLLPLIYLLLHKLIDRTNYIKVSRAR